MGTRDPEQPPLWIAASDLPVSPGHPFYTRLNALLDADGFDTFVEDACRSRIRHQAAAGSWTMPRQWEIPRTWLNSARAAVRSPAKPNGV